MSEALRQLRELASTPVPDPEDLGQETPPAPANDAAPAPQMPLFWSTGRPVGRFEEPTAKVQPPTPEAVERLARELMEQAERVGLDANSCMSRGVRIADQEKTLAYYRCRATAELMRDE